MSWKCATPEQEFHLSRCMQYTTIYKYCQVLRNGSIAWNTPQDVPRYIYGIFNKSSSSSGPSGRGEVCSLGMVAEQGRSVFGIPARNDFKVGEARPFGRKKSDAYEIIKTPHASEGTSQKRGGCDCPETRGTSSLRPCRPSRASCDRDIRLAVLREANIEA